MGQTKKMKISFAVVAVVMTTLLAWLLFHNVTSAEPLTAEEATNKVQDLYDGKIVEVKEAQKQYLITIELETGIYKVEIDRETGEVGEMTRSAKEAMDTKEPAQPDSQQQNDSPKQPETDPGTQTPKDPAAETPPAAEPIVKQITEQEAVNIALGEVNGEVDDIEIIQSGGTTYYLVDVENEAEEDGEATVQIHAISGEVISITWDD